MSESLSGENNPMYGKRGKDSPNFGSKRTAESCKKISEALKGKTLSLEIREKMSKARKGTKHPMFGKTLSVEHKQQISKANKDHRIHHFYNEELGMSIFGKQLYLRQYSTELMGVCGQSASNLISGRRQQVKSWTYVGFH